VGLDLGTLGAAAARVLAMTGVVQSSVENPSGASADRRTARIAGATASRATTQARRARRSPNSSLLPGIRVRA